MATWGRTEENTQTVLSTLPSELPLDFLKKITDLFSEERIIGTGAFGTVYVGTMPDAQLIAVKRLQENVLLPRANAFANEVQNIMALQNDNIVKLVGYCNEGQRKLVKNNGRYMVTEVFERLLCYEYLPMGSLQKNLFEGPSNMVWQTRFKIIRGFCNGLLFLHGIPIIHMDLKAENILLDHNMMPKIADIGLSRLFGLEQTRANTQNLVGSYGYLAPEFVYRGEVSTHTDIYSIGLLIIETTTGEKNQPKQIEPSSRGFIEKVHKKWTDGHIAYMYQQLNPNDLLEVKLCIEIGLECVQIDRTKRPSIENIVERLDGCYAIRMANQFDKVEAGSSTCTKNYLLATEPRAMTYQELHRMTDGFSEKRLLGKGGYGKVYKGILDDGEVIAVKKLYSRPDLDDRQFENELLNLTRVRHQNIIRLVGYCSETRDRVTEYEGRYVVAGEQERLLCLEYMQGGTLEERLSDELGGLDWEARYNIIKGICQGLKYLHMGCKDPIYHMDLKPANILLDKDMTPKIGDFGLSRLLGSTHTCVTKTSLGTIGYRPPEYIEGLQISPKFDVYSLGVIIIQVIAGRENYFNSPYMSSQQFIELVTGNWCERVQAEKMSTESLGEVQKCIKIALRCTLADREKRPTIAEIVEELNMSDIQPVPFCVDGRNETTHA